MKEIEVKAKAGDISQLKEKFISLGCEFFDPVVQDDRIYLKKGDSLDNRYPGLVALRIRSENGKHILTLKKRRENDLDNIECEIIIDNPDQAHDMLLHLGYDEVSHVHKTRHACSYNGLGICLDEVEGLGSFIEVEKMTEEDDGAAVQSELFCFLQTLGISEADRVTIGYDVLMHQMQNQKD